MAKNIPVTDDVYRELDELRREYESFSSLIRRLLRTQAKISNLVGSSTLNIEEWLEMKQLESEQAKMD
ncbi:MAG: antitoxin VapB family protein [Candidatus Thorarchaeota archaeon]